MREKTWRVPKDVVRVCLHQCDKLHLHVSKETTSLFHGGMSANSVNANGKEAMALGNSLRDILSF